jgi:ribosomal-protein-alanine N-acetyltransferase
MSAVEKQPRIKTMPYAVRPLAEGDINQAAEIERDAFPTLFPPTSFRRELRNKMARYIVAWKPDDSSDRGISEESVSTQSSHSAERPLFSRIFNGARGIFPRRPSTWQPGQQYIAGFLGIWYMVDEAHIVAVGVRNELRGQGIGELLLIAAIEQAIQMNAKAATLEVRVSNHVAQNLYKKYGFKTEGRRRGYYTDNREDALIMTTSPIRVSPYPEKFRQLVIDHTHRWGHSERIVF